MKIIVNGNEEEVEQNINLLNYLADKKLEPAKLVVEYNQQIVKEDKFEEITLEAGDSLELLNFVGGG